MKNDKKIQRNIYEELAWEPRLDGLEINVDVNDGVATLSGMVYLCAEKRAAETAAASVGGVRFVQNLLEIEMQNEQDCRDEIIEQVAKDTLEWNLSIFEKVIEVEVKNGWVTLEGEVDWDYIKEAALTTVSNLHGVRGVTNNLCITYGARPDNPEEQFNMALKKDSLSEDDEIELRTEATKPILNRNGYLQAVRERLKKVVKSDWALF